MGTGDSTALGRKDAPSPSGPAGPFVRSRHPAAANGSTIGGEASFRSLLQDPGAGFRHGPVPLLVSGVDSADLEGHFPAAHRVGILSLRFALRRWAPPFVVVLGDEALRRLSPSVIGPLLRRPGCASLATAHICPAYLVAAWARWSPIEFVPQDRLPWRVAAVCRLGDGSPVPAESSIAPLGTEAMARALHALQQTGNFRVKTWASALGMSRHALRRLCAGTLGVTPDELAWTFLDTRVRREVLHRRNDAQIAASLGIASAYALRRAYARRGIPFPRS